GLAPVCVTPGQVHLGSSPKLAHSAYLLGLRAGDEWLAARAIERRRKRPRSRCCRSRAGSRLELRAARFLRRRLLARAASFGRVRSVAIRTPSSATGTDLWGSLGGPVATRPPRSGSGRRR